MNNNTPPNNKGNGNNNGGKAPKNTQNMLMFAVFVIAAILVWALFNNQYTQATSQEITYDKFLDMLEADEVASVEDTGSTWKITPKEKDKDGVTLTYYTGKMANDTELLPLMREKNVEIQPYIQNDAMISIALNILSIVVPMILLWVLFSGFMRRMGGGGGVMGVGKSKAKVYIEKDTGVTFKDVAGEEEAKESLVEVVDFLHNPEKYTEIGAKLPKGALLVGPPGTGKTLLAKAVAGEAHVPFFSLAGSDFVEMFVGVGASRVRDLFEEAKKNAPCIVFIDEIDAIGKSRDSRMGGNDEREQTLNQLLAEMDGFESNQACIILAATNRPEVLDQALLRPGRFDRRIIVERPDLKGREDILKVHVKNVKLDETVDLAAVALATSGAVGADLANMINEAAIMAVKNGRKAICQKDLFDAMEVVMMGKEKKNKILSEEERKVVSYHEVGHALTSALQKDAEPVQKITIIPRTSGALGYVLQTPEEEKFLLSKKEILARLVVCMGGRAAEEVVFDSVTTGASNDIQQATNLARAMVTQYGMSEKFGLMGLESRESMYLDNGSVLNCSDETASHVDEEVMRILKEAYEEAKRLLTENRECLDQISAFLIEKETITGKEFMEIFHKVRDEANEYHQEELIFAE
ncbi:MAG: ATP-dependent zinc metalloprotease FtsH [Clostridiaceae bacterium]|nr:ATP-dependent zinc metalloprotease FtsH [Clostridiaceae bacterium]MDD5798517.1 ATP-dependent zinc metalloprotease FtsH [Clostridiaceae bacterium]MDY4547069.1 ATP-dependent zinc metalloprotease FtsH [Candidatus Choladocola sp.]